MRILIATAELAPHAVVGRVGETVAALAAALAREGHDVCVALPAHGGAHRHRALDLEPSGRATELPLGNARVRVEFLHGADPAGFEVVLVRAPGFFERTTLYDTDDAARYLLFSKAVVELARLLRPTPDLLHLHDWPAAPVAAFARASRLAIPSVLTLHGTEHQGRFHAADFALTNLGPDWFTPDTFEFHGDLNLLKGGLLAADAVTVPGSMALHSVLEPSGAHGLEGVLRARHAALQAVQHGPLPEPPARLPARSAGVARNRRLATLGLAPDPSGPVFLLPRADERAMDLLGPVLDRLLADDVRLAVGGPLPDSRRAPVEIALRRHPGRVVRVEGELAAALSAADLGLALARPEPDGGPLPALLAAGLPPIAPAAPGIHALARDDDPAEHRGWAFLFYREEPEALYDAIRRAKRAWSDPELRRAISQRALRHAPSWTGAARQLTALFEAVRSVV